MTINSRIQSLSKINSSLRGSLRPKLFDISKTEALKATPPERVILAGNVWICIDGSPLQTEVFKLCTPIIFFDLLNKYMTVALKANCEQLSWPMMNMLPLGSYVVAVLCHQNTSTEIRGLTKVLENQEISDLILGIEYLDVSVVLNRSATVYPLEGTVEFQMGHNTVCLKPSFGLTLPLKFSDLFKITPIERINILQAQR